MKIVTLVDNRTHSNNLDTEHGLSLYIETDDNKKILYDTGQTEMFIDNAKKLGIDLSLVDIVVISHGHYDHIGGLLSFLSMNSRAKVYLNANIFRHNYFSVKNGVKSINGFSGDLQEMHSDRLVFVDKNTKIDNLWFITKIEKIYPTPKGNAILYREERDGSNEELDPFDHELILVIETQKGLCILTGCAHNGVLNIVASVQKTIPGRDIMCIYGGYHLIENKGYVEVESEQELIDIANELTVLAPNAQFLTGHCTGNRAIEVLSNKINNQFAPFYVGKEVTF